MIDLHCHLLPGIDDGAKDEAMSLAMARSAVADGITVVACTPHIMPGVYENEGPDIAAAVTSRQAVLGREGIALRLVVGADVHVDPGLVAGLRSGRIPTLNGSRYFLFEPPHHVAPPRLEDSLFSILSAGYVPVLTHPERLSWAEGNYDLIVELSHRGVLMQLTGGSITGRFGRQVQRFADRMLDDGIVHLIASDAHNDGSRPLRLSGARDILAERYGREEAENLTLHRPKAILDNRSPGEMPKLPEHGKVAPQGSFWSRLGMRLGRK